MNRVDSINRGVMDVKPLDCVEVPSLEGKVSDEEWAIRLDLAAAYRMVAHYGWDDLIFTHLSARIPGPEHQFLLNPYNLMFEEVTASSLVPPSLAAGFSRSSAMLMVVVAIRTLRIFSHGNLRYTPGGITRTCG